MYYFMLTHGEYSDYMVGGVFEYTSPVSNELLNEWAKDYLCSLNLNLLFVRVLLGVQNVYNPYSSASDELYEALHKLEIYSLDSLDADAEGFEAYILKNIPNLKKLSVTEVLDGKIL